MKPSFFLLALATAAITSCTSAYKSGQTPDDVYFSPQREQSEYVAVNNKDDDDSYYEGDDYYSDRQLRMKVQNRNQWSNLDEWYYNTDRYSYSYYDGFYGNNPWTANSFWNYNYNPYFSGYFNPYFSSYSYYNPYYSPVYYIGTKGNNSYASYNRPRMFNLNTYNRQLTNSNYVTRRIDLNSAPAARNTNRYNNNYNNSRSNAGDYLRNSFNNNNNNNSRPSNNTNTSTPSSSGRSSSGSSSSGSGGGSAPVRRF